MQTEDGNSSLDESVQGGGRKKMVWVYSPCKMHGVKTQNAIIWLTSTTET